MARISINEPLRSDCNYMLSYEKPVAYKLWGTEEAKRASSQGKLLMQGLYSQGFADPGLDLQGYRFVADRIEVYFRTGALYQSELTPASLRFTLCDLENGLYTPLRLLEAEIFVYPPADLIKLGLTIWGKDLSVVKPERVEPAPEYDPLATKVALTIPAGEAYPVKKEAGITIPTWEPEPTPPPEPEKKFPWKWVLLGAFIIGALVSVKGS